MRVRLQRKRTGTLRRAMYNTIAVESTRDVGLAAGIFRGGVGPLVLRIKVQLRRGVWPAVGCGGVRRASEVKDEARPAERERSCFVLHCPRLYSFQLLFVSIEQQPLDPSAFGERLVPLVVQVH